MKKIYYVICLLFCISINNYTASSKKIGYNKKVDKKQHKFLDTSNSKVQSPTRALPSCVALPDVYDSSTIIELTNDIVINNSCELVAGGPNFGITQQDRVTFHATNSRAIRITKDGVWRMLTFNTQNKVIEFSGNAQLILEPGAQMIMNNGKLLMSDNAQLITITV